MHDIIKTIELTFVNAFLVNVNECFVLIDTGLSMHWDRLEKELAAAGCLPDRLKLVIVTHGDYDHTGNCAKLQEKYKCKIAMHRNDVLMAQEGLMVKRKVRTFTAKIFIQFRRLLRKKLTFDKFTPDIFLTMVKICSSMVSMQL